MSIIGVNFYTGLVSFLILVVFTSLEPLRTQLNVNLEADYQVFQTNGFCAVETDQMFNYRATDIFEHISAQEPIIKLDFNVTLEPKAQVSQELARLEIELLLAVNHLPTEVKFDPRLVGVLTDIHFDRINTDSTSQCIRTLKEKIVQLEIEE